MRQYHDIFIFTIVRRTNPVRSNCRPTLTVPTNLIQAKGCQCCRRPQPGAGGRCSFVGFCCGFCCGFSCVSCRLRRLPNLRPQPVGFWRDVGCCCDIRCLRPQWLLRSSSPRCARVANWRQERPGCTTRSAFCRGRRSGPRPLASRPGSQTSVRYGHLCEATGRPTSWRMSATLRLPPGLSTPEESSWGSW